MLDLKCHNPVVQPRLVSSEVVELQGFALLNLTVTRVTVVIRLMVYHWLLEHELSCRCDVQHNFLQWLLITDKEQLRTLTDCFIFDGWVDNLEWFLKVQLLHCQLDIPQLGELRRKIRDAEDVHLGAVSQVLLEQLQEQVIGPVVQRIGFKLLVLNEVHNEVGLSACFQTTRMFRENLPEAGCTVHCDFEEVPAK